MWFIQIESKFRVRGIITSGTKYDYLVSSLPTEIIEMISDFISNPPKTDAYNKLKKLVLSRGANSEQRRLDNLLNHIEIGDQKPSELYRLMESLASDNSLVNKDLLWELWIQKLPSSLQPCVIAMKETHQLDQVFILVDRIHESTRPKSKIFLVRTDAPSSASNPGLISAISELIGRLKNLETRFSRFRSRDRQRQSRNFSNGSSRDHFFSRSEDFPMETATYAIINDVLAIMPGNAQCHAT